MLGGGGDQIASAEPGADSAASPNSCEAAISAAIANSGEVSILTANANSGEVSIPTANANSGQAGISAAYREQSSALDFDIRIIVAHSQNRVIGRDGDMPWRLRDDLRFFREQTTGHTVVMGRKTFDSIGKPLPNRTNVVITRDRNFEAEGVVVVHSPEEALAVEHGVGARIGGGATLFVIGGGQIYEALLPFAARAYVTVVDAVLDGDTRFPELGAEWEWTELRRHGADERNDYSFTIYEVTRLRT